MFVEMVQTGCMVKLASTSKKLQNASKGGGLAALQAPPDGNHGDNIKPMTAPNLPPADTRSRLSVECSPVVTSLLDHISEVTGVAKSQIITGALLDALPSLLARADGLKKRQGELKGRK